jgi:acyl-CoA hydrolase
VTVIQPEALRLAEWIRSNDRVLVAHSTGEPATLLEALVAQRADYAGARPFMHASFSGIVRPEHADCLAFSGLSAIGTQRVMAKAGVLDVIPMHLSDFNRALVDGSFIADVVLLQVSPPDELGRYSLSLVNDFQVAAARNARVVIAECNDQAPFTFGGPFLSDADIDVLVPTNRPLVEIAPGKIGSTEREVANHAVQFLRDGSVVQFGVGAIPDAIAAGMAGFRDIGVHSGVVPDAIMPLIEAGAVSNARKRIDPGISVTGAIWGTRGLYDFVHQNPAIAVRPLSYTHAAQNFARLDNYVSFNTALEVDLTGQANVEVAGGAYLGGVGGAVDFVRGARLAPNGRSVVALSATAAGGKVSKIVAELSGPVTIARSDIDTVVTEFGAAELHGQPLAERARRMIAIAHPDHREHLEHTIHGIRE